MEIFVTLVIVLLVFFYLMGRNSKYSPSNPILRKDLKSDSDIIELKEGKKILREFMKDVSTVNSIVVKKIGIPKNDITKRDINEWISSTIQDFSDSFKYSLDDLKFEISELKKDISEDTNDNDKEDLELLMKKLKLKDCSNDLLWQMNELIGVSRKDNAILSRNNYNEI